MCARSVTASVATVTVVSGDCPESARVAAQPPRRPASTTAAPAATMTAAVRPDVAAGLGAGGRISVCTSSGEARTGRRPAAARSRSGRRSASGSGPGDAASGAADRSAASAARTRTATAAPRGGSASARPAARRARPAGAPDPTPPGATSRDALRHPGRGGRSSARPASPGRAGRRGRRSAAAAARRTSPSGIRCAGSLTMSAAITSATGPARARPRDRRRRTTSVIVASGSPRRRRAGGPRPRRTASRRAPTGRRPASTGCARGDLGRDVGGRAEHEARSWSSAARRRCGRCRSR